MNYDDFLQQKLKTVKPSGFDVDDVALHASLFPFQRWIVKRALKAGKYAIFADCGLGKTFMQLQWAQKVHEKTGKPVLILCPLAVSGQTLAEAEHWEFVAGRPGSAAGIVVTNYEQLDNLDPSSFGGVVLDESSILKNFTGKIKNQIIDSFQGMNYKLACTATPAPNDLNEIGNHSEFLDIMDAPDMRMRWFVRDEGMNNYRLKNHAKQEFYEWIGSWSTVIQSPADCGFPMNGYDLPGLNIKELKIETEKKENDLLFNDLTVSATDFNSELRRSMTARLEKVVEIVKSKPDESFLIWIHHNEEGAWLTRRLAGSVEVSGQDAPHIKEKNLLDFAKGTFKILITKPKIAQFGMNYQNCHNQIFASLDFSFESFYQSIRRSYRFGQESQVNAYLITTDTMGNVLESINRKRAQFQELVSGIVKITNAKEYRLKMDYKKREEKTDWYHVFNGDSVEIIKEIPDNSIDLSVFSPPFSTLFTYSDSLRDMGNCETDEQFFQNMRFLLKDLYRIIKPGRLVCVHTKDLAVYKNSSGYSGMKDFTGDFHREMEAVGFKYHSKVTIWTDPVLEMQRTKTQRLLYKTLTSDSSYTGIGMPEYVTIFRKWEGNEEDWEPVNWINRENFPLDQWQQWASPVWMDILRTDVLTNWKNAKDVGDEKHICPLQLPVIERCVGLWSNPGETVFTPFMGIGSEVWQAVRMGRKGIGIELKDSYFDQALENLRPLLEEKTQAELF